MMARQSYEPKRALNFPVPNIRTDSFSRQYVPGLARFPGDPQAVVSSRSEIRRLAAQQGLRCSGVVGCEVDHLELNEPKPYTVAEDIVQREVDRLVDRDYGGKRSNLPKGKLDDVTEGARERLSGARD